MRTPLNPATRFNLPARWLLFFSGLFILSLGVAITVHAGLGTTTISSPPAVLAAATGYSLGIWTVVLNLVLMLLIAAILRRDYQLRMLWQFPLSIIFGAMCDFNLWLSSGVATSNYLLAWVLVILGTVTVALGIFLQLLAQIAFMAGEALVQALNTKLHRLDFGSCKQIVDWSLVATAALISWFTMHDFIGVREGTIFAAFGIGFCVRLWEKLYLKTLR